MTGIQFLYISVVLYLMDCVHLCSTSVMKCILPSLVLGNPKPQYSISVVLYLRLSPDNLCCCINSNLALVCVCMHLLSVYVPRL